MHNGMWTPRVLLGLGFCLVFCGCVGLGGPNALQLPGRMPDRPRSDKQDGSGTATPSGPMARAEPPAPTEIPLVPVPPLPRSSTPTVPPVAPSQVRTMPQADPGTALKQPAPQPGAGPTARQLVQQAMAAYAGFDSYIARLTRREPARGKNNQEILIFYFRKNPWSIHFKWLAGEGQGREVLYVKDRYENKLHTLLAAGDVPLLPAGRRISLPIDSPLVKMANRHPITHAGLGPMIERFGQALDAADRGDFRQGKFTVLGTQGRPDYEEGPLVLVEQTLPPGADEDAPAGGRRLIGFDLRLGLPVLAILYDEQNREVDYYRFDRLQLGVHLNDADFDPDQMGKRNDPNGPMGK